MKSDSSLFFNLALAPFVVAMRLPIIATEMGDTGKLGAELMKAIGEKQLAMAQGAIAAQLSLMQAAGRFWPDAISGKVPSLLDGSAFQSAARSSLGPASRSVRSNFRRLSARRVA